MIAENLKKVKSEIPDKVTLIAVSKTKPVEDILEAYNTGHRDFGENKVQEMVDKYERLPKDIQWHMIGHLQRNKVKYMAHFVHLIHGVDSFKLLREINKQAKKCDRVIDCLLQAKIAEEDSKFGLSFEEITQILNSDEFKALENIRVIGLMGMATFTDDEEQLKREFESLHSKYKYHQTEYRFDTLSMGMSGDYKLAIDHGSTMIRIGSSIFGARNYQK